MASSKSKGIGVKGKAAAPGQMAKATGMPAKSYAPGQVKKAAVVAPVVPVKPVMPTQAKNAMAPGQLKKKSK